MSLSLIQGQFWAINDVCGDLVTLDGNSRWDPARSIEPTHCALLSPFKSIIEKRIEKLLDTIT